MAVSHGGTDLRRWLSGLAPEEYQYLRWKMAAEGHDVLKMEVDAFKQRMSHEMVIAQVEDLRKAAGDKSKELNADDTKAKCPHLLQFQQKYLEKINKFRSWIDEEDEITKAFVAAKEEEENRRGAIYKLTLDTKDRLSTIEDQHTLARLALRTAAQATEELRVRKDELRARMKALPEEIMT